MRELTLNEANVIAGGINPSIATAPNTVVVAPAGRSSLVSDLVSVAGLVAGAYYGFNLVSSIPAISYAVKGIDVGHHAASALGTLGGATVGYVAGLAYAKYGLTAVNTMV